MTGHRPRLLYLAFYFPPSRASGVYRPRATANRLTELGWDVTVFAAPWRSCTARSTPSTTSCWRPSTRGSRWCGRS
ncbi:hypothetical protein [Actinomadura madurae]|uniref:hypothetical protein n=1 Tax=Actinomadura madurae TaxID=1993 RepID=UPI0020266BFA|nr:hypothetical protein [Actinomadura madurae]MCP9967991.1 hypothetical protein [Actinomadura madurae]MCP9980448.1 hypothetical protein [Actinomadura madurae]URM96740.1 hypothetical protein LUW76_21680 [Actinomadura madurae]